MIPKSIFLYWTKFYPPPLKMLTIPEEVQKWIIDSKDEELYKKLARCHNIIPEAQLFLAKCDYIVCQNLADNISINEETQIVLADSGDEVVYNLLADNPSATPEVLEKLHKEWDENIHHKIARNPNTPTEILEELTKNKYPSIAQAAGNHLRNRK